jgi:uncharacterized membrane protein
MLHSSALTLPHLLNIGVHVLAGVVGILIAVGVLLRRKGDARHRRAGRWFIGCGAVLVVTATIGGIAFTFRPLFALLTLLVGYQLLGAWRSVQFQRAGPGRVDLLCTVVAAMVAGLLLPTLHANGGNATPIVIQATLGALFALLAYDLIRFVLPQQWRAGLWPYEHAYKMLGAFAGMLSAFAGNVLIRWQPWSQVLPSLFGGVLVLYFFWRIARGRAFANARAERLH